MGARVFVSCGQRENSIEIESADKIASRLVNLGYTPYIAAEQRSLRSLRENIFRQLRDTEYFLFIDFPREELVSVDGRPSGRRGSLFAHQELAIASYLDIAFLAFQQRGVKRLDGLLGHLQANAIPFEDPQDLPDLVATHVAKDWSPAWRNEISLEFEPTFHEAMVRDVGATGLFAEIRVRNRHRSTPARDCYAYLREIVDVSTNMPIPFDTAELKWAGTRLANVTIMPQQARELDAFWISERDLSTPLFNVHTDSSRHRPQIVGPGEWRVTYDVVSSNLPSASICLNVLLDGTRAGILVGKCEHPKQAPRGQLTSANQTTTVSVVEGDALLPARRIDRERR